MTYPGGPGQGAGQGYGLGVQPQGVVPYPPAVSYGPARRPGRGIPFFLNIGVAALGIVSFFLGFAPYLTIGVESKGMASFRNSGPRESIDFFSNLGFGVGVIGLGLLVTAALLASFGLIPKVRDNGAGVAALSIAGFLCLLFLMFGLADGILGTTFHAGVGLILVLVTAFLQSALAVAAMLIDAGVIKLGGGHAFPPGYAPPPYPVPAPPGLPTQVAYGPPVNPFGPTLQAGTTYPSPYQRP